ncbi:MAG: hypothetical protein HOP28_15215 [Gemmatimonadales bacterium]|nr:hypothetical protein [Gemmatimonadales bacterium]
MRSAVALLALSIVPAAAHGQACLGQTPYASGAVKVLAGVEIGGNDQTVLGGGAGIGKPKSWFAGLNAGIATGNGESAFGVGGMGGLELKKPVTGKLELCPMAGIFHQFGDFSYNNFIAAVGASYPIGSESAKTKLMLVGGYQGIYQRYNLPAFDGFDGATAEEWYGNLDLGLGMIFNNRFSLVPQVRIPIRYGGGRDISFLVRGSVNVGGN